MWGKINPSNIDCRIVLFMSEFFNTYCEHNWLSCFSFQTHSATSHRTGARTLESRGRVHLTATPHSHKTGSGLLKEEDLETLLDFDGTKIAFKNTHLAMCILIYRLL